VRGDTCYGFGAEVINSDNNLDRAVSVLVARLKEIKILNQRLLEEKHKVLQSYKNLLKPILEEFQK
jgi:hypothetical protein